MDDARTTKRLKVTSASSAAEEVTCCDDESFFTDKKQHQTLTGDDTIDALRKHQNHDCDFPQQHLLLSEYKLNEARTEIVLAETKRDIEMVIERIYREAMKLDHFCDGGGSGGTFGRNQSLVVGFDMEWKVLYKKGGGEAKTSLLQMAYSTTDVSTKSSSSKSKNVVVLIRLGKRLKYKNPLPSKLVRFLEDPAVRKAGVNARGDAQKLRRDFKVRVNGVVELDALAKAKNVVSGDGSSSGKSVSGKEQERDNNNRNASQRWSLARLAIRVLKKRVPKDGNTRTSNWERDGKLDKKQLTYAAIDAMVGLDLWVALNKMRGDGYEMDPVPEGFVFRGRILEGEYDPDDDDEEEEEDDDEVEYDEEEIEPYAALREAALTTLENETTISGQPEQPKTKEQLELTRGAKRKTPIPEDVEEILIQHLGGKAVEDIAETLKLTSADISKKLTIAFKAGHPYYWDLLGVSNDIWLTFLQSREEKALATIRERLPNGAADMPKILLCACRFAREVLRDGKQLEGDESAEDDDDDDEEESSSEENDDEDDDASEEEEEGKKE